MLVDAGAASAADDRLVEYLDDFFAERSDLHKTLDLVLITHNHLDHTQALMKVASRFQIKKFIDNGWTKGSGAPQTNALKQQVKAKKLKTQVRSVSDKQITALPAKTGLTNDFIDPFDCADIDPVVRVLSGSMDTNPGWSAADFKDANNHSLMTRVDFGDGSILFLGDAEVPATDLLLDYYNGADANILDVDVLQVSHHGSNNGTSPQLVAAVTPKVAIVPVGHWSDGRKPPRQFSTFAYGHPNLLTLQALDAVMDRERGEALEVMAGTSAKHFKKAIVSKAIYATDWDGTIRVRVGSDGSLRVTRAHAH